MTISTYFKLKEPLEEAKEKLMNPFDEIYQSLKDTDKYTGNLNHHNIIYFKEEILNAKKALNL